MKKVTILFDKQLQKLLADDQDFRKIAVFRHALAVINFIVELSATGIVPPPNFPILSNDLNVPETIRLTESELALFVAAYKTAGRIKAYIRPGTVAVCLAVEITFCGKDRCTSPLLIVHAGVDSMAVRKFGMDAPISEYLVELYQKGRKERREREIKEVNIRAMERIGP